MSEMLCYVNVLTLRKEEKNKTLRIFFPSFCSNDPHSINEQVILDVRTKYKNSFNLKNVMMWYTHIIFGLLLGLVSLRFIPQSHPLLYLFFVSVAALLPDIDHPHSFINQRIAPTRFVSHFLTHRGFFHSLFPVFLLYLFVVPLHKDVALALSLGYLSHILIDGCTKSGVNLFHPLGTLRLQGFIETGSLAELVVFGFLLVGVVLLTF